MYHDLVGMSVVSHLSEFNANKKWLQNDLVDTKKFVNKCALTSFFHKNESVRFP